MSGFCMDPAKHGKNGQWYTVKGHAVCSSCNTTTDSKKVVGKIYAAQKRKAKAARPKPTGRLDLNAKSKVSEIWEEASREGVHDVRREP